MPDYTVVDSYNVNELVELEMELQKARNNRNNNRNEKIDYDYNYDNYELEESEEEKKARREYLTTGELPRRGGVFTIYNGLRTRR